MQYKRKHEATPLEPDMTPMIDMTFLLIAFFMVLIDFSKAETESAVVLPSSELAKPSDELLESPLFLHLLDTGQVIFNGAKSTIEGVRRPLLIKYQELEAKPSQSPKDATIVIRAHRSAKTGRVQELIKVCQDVGFESFALRAKFDKERFGGE